MLEEEAKGKKSSEFFSTAGSMLGGLLGGRKSKTKMIGDLLGDAGTAARRRGSTSASDRRVDAAENKVQRLVDQYDELEADLEAGRRRHHQPMGQTPRQRSRPMTIGLERTDVKVTHLVLAWVPVA